MTAGFDEEGVAAQWVARMDSGDWTDADEAELQRWLAARPSRHGLLLRTQAIWLSAERLYADAVEEWKVGEGAARSLKWSRRMAVGGIAVAAGVAAISGLRRRTPVGGGVGYATELGEIRRVPLADGSVMTINSASELAVRMDVAERQVELARGEAWFDVAKDAARPFVVSARGVKAQAIGTAFSVRMRDAAVEVLVNEGTVEAWSDEASGQKIRITAGQRALIGDNSEVRMEPEQSSSVDRALAWRSGLIDLNGTTLSDAIEEFNRYNERKIVLANADTGTELVDGVFRINDPVGFALSIEASLDLPVQVDDATGIKIGK